MSELKTVYNKLFKTELASQKVELAMDFSKIIKDTDTQLKSTSIASDKLNKAAAVYVEAKKAFERYKNVPSVYQKNVDGYYKEYDKKANDLGIDTKTTQFYKEYLDVVSKIGQIADNIEQMKSTIASSK
jgi:hypothetical protein